MARRTTAGIETPKVARVRIAGWLKVDRDAFDLHSD